MKRRTWILGSAGVITTAFAKADQTLIQEMGFDFKWVWPMRLFRWKVQQMKVVGL